MIKSRCWHSVSYLNGAVYAFGGFDGSERLKHCEGYDIELDQWSEKASLNVARSNLASCIVNDRFIYAFGGYGQNNQMSLSSIEKFNPEQKCWQLLELQLPKKMNGMAAISLKYDDVLIVGGCSGTVTKRNIYRLQLSTMQWGKPKKFIAPRQLNDKIFLFNSGLYLLGGNSNYNGEVFNLTKGAEWELLPSFKHLVINELYNWSGGLI